MALGQRDLFLAFLRVHLGDESVQEAEGRLAVSSVQSAGSGLQFRHQAVRCPRLQTQALYQRDQVTDLLGWILDFEGSYVRTIAARRIRPARQIKAAHE